MNRKERFWEAIWVVFFGGLPRGMKPKKKPTRMEGLEVLLQTGLKREKAELPAGDNGDG